MSEITFLPLSQQSSDTCSCGKAAFWEMWIDRERQPLCTNCCRLELIARIKEREELLSDRLHCTWLIYPWDRTE